MIRILLVDDHEMVRIGVSAYLQAQSDMEVAGEAANGAEAIIREWPEAKIMIVTSFLDDDKVYPALKAGAVSYILKTSKASRIADSIRETMNGTPVLEPEVMSKMMKQMRHERVLHENLTEREMEILLLLAHGYTNQEIADELYIALKTVKSHVSNLLAKLEVHDRTQAVIYAFQHKLVAPKD